MELLIHHTVYMEQYYLSWEEMLEYNFSAQQIILEYSLDGLIRMGITSGLIGFKYRGGLALTSILISLEPILYY